MVSRGPAQGQRHAPALRLAHDGDAHLRERIEDAAHRPLAQGGVAVEGGGDRVAAGDAHHQPRAGAGIAEIEHVRRARRGRRCRRRGPASGPGPRGRSPAPSARQASAVRSTSSPSSRPSTRVSPIDEQPEDQGAVRDRLVAGDAQAPLAGRPPALPATGDAGPLSCDIPCPIRRARPGGSLTRAAGVVIPRAGSRWRPSSRFPI